MPELFVTNFNRNYTGVSATAANVIRQQAKTLDLALVGHPLPGCPDPVTPRTARALSRTPPPGRPFAIWHVRRNPEMRAAIWARDVLGLPIRIVFTSAAQRLHSLYPRWLISRMDAVIATTDKAAGFVPHVRAVVPHGVDTDRFTPAPDRAAAWAALGHGGTFGIASIGRVRPEKGTDVFVDAMLHLLPELPGAVALVVGRAGKDHHRFDLDLKDRVQRAGMANRIRFTGEIPPQDLPDLMRALSLVVQLPRYEGYGMVPLEAMASATPFVGSDAGWFRAFSAGGQCGTVVPGQSPAAAEAARAILTDPERLDIMSNAARNTATRDFSATTEATAITAVYNRLWRQSD